MGIEYKDSKRISILSPQTLSQSSGGTDGSTVFYVTSSNERHFVGQEFNTGHTLIDETINSVTFYMKHNAPNSVYKLVHLDSSDGKTDLEDVDLSYSGFVSGGSLVPVTFNSFTPFILSAGDKIGIWADGVTGGNSGNWIKIEEASNVDSNAERYVLENSPVDGASGTSNPDLKYTIGYGIAKPTNVQDNSILVEKDTGKRYWFDAESIDTTGLKAYYKFNEASGDIINQHTTGDGLASADLTVTGSTYSATGKIGNAVSNDGSNDFMVSPSSTKTDFNFIHALNQAWSINIWFKKANANDGGITAFIANRAGGDIGIRIKNLDRSGEGETRKLQLEVDSGAGGMYDSNVDSFFPNDTDWHMITITADNSITTNAMQVYLDGTLDHNVNRVSVGDGGTPEYPMNFAQEGDSSDFGDYTFDETSFWTRKLSSTDVTTLYNSDSGFAITPATWALEFFPATDTTLFSTSTGWTGDTAIFTNSGDTMVWDTSTRGTAVVKTITTLPTSGEWVMRFKFTKLTGDAMDGTMFNIGSSSASTSSLARMQDGNGLYPYGLHLYGSNGSTIVGGGAHNTSFAWDGQGATLETGTWDVGESRWLQIQHFDATSATWKLYDNANFTGTPIGTATVTSMAGQSLDYDNFAIGTKWGTGRKHESIEDMQIWNGVTSPP